MRSTLRPLAPFAAVALIAPAVLASQEQSAVFRAGISGVSVSVSVRQGNAPVTGLTAADFVLTDNGVPQRVIDQSFETLPIDVTLLLDASGSVEGSRLGRMKAGVVETAALLDADDRLRLIAVQHELHQVFPFQPGGQVPPVDNLRAVGGTALFDGLSAAMMRAAEPDRRQLIVLYTDGQDTISVLDLGTATGIAGFAEAVVHIVVPVTNGRDPRSDLPGVAGLETLAARTGGQLFAVDIRDAIGEAFRQAIEEFRTSYVLRYVPSGVEEGGWHEINVTVPSNSYEVRARRGYGG